MEEYSWAKNMLENKLLPFWLSLKDEDNGGFCGYVDDKTLERNWKSVKGAIYHARILWFMSEVALFYKDSNSSLFLRAKEGAESAYKFIKTYFYDKDKGGVIWSVDYKGLPFDSTKHTYAMAFTIYGLSSFYLLEKTPEVLELINKIYSDIESHCWDGNGYKEAFSSNWESIGNEKLSENGVEAERTMNTLLHVIEAYSNYYRATKNDVVKEKLEALFSLYLNKIVDYSNKRLKVFMDKNYNSIIDLWSYGHDIEASWLMDWGVSQLDNEKLKNEVFSSSSMLAESVFDYGLNDGWLLNEREKGVDDKTVNWWVQCEAVLGFMHHCLKSGDEKYMREAEIILESIDSYLVDKREGGEWHSEILPSGFIGDRAEAELWKSAYHNGRLVLELLKGERG